MHTVYHLQNKTEACVNNLSYSTAASLTAVKNSGKPSPVAAETPTVWNAIVITTELITYQRHDKVLLKCHKCLTINKGRDDKPPPPSVYWRHSTA